MIRTIVMLTFWAVSILIVGPFLLMHAFITRNVEFMYQVATWLGITGVRVAGIKIEVRGLERLDPSQSYIFLSNHVSNLDPPVLVPSIPGRCSVLVKKEVFRLPILGTAMRMADMVPVDRHNRESAIESVRAAVEVMRRHVHMVIFVEGTRSGDGRLLPFKKGPFHLAMEVGVPIVPVTLLGTYECWPKGQFASHAGTTTVIFHQPVHTSAFTDRDALMAAVRETIASALPEDKRN